MKKNTLKKNNKGFSLVELIVVICIMAVLVAILAPQFMKFVGKSKVSADAQQIEEMETTLGILATELPADAKYTVTIYHEDAEKPCDVDPESLADKIKEYAGDTWADDTAMKSDDYSQGAKITMEIGSDYKVTITSEAITENAGNQENAGN